MAVILRSTLIIIFIVELITGTLGNGFIVLVNCMDWLRRRKISSVDRIFTALAICRIALLWIGVLDGWMSVISPNSLVNEKFFRLMYVTWAIINHFCIWLATSLGIFYFFKIATFANPLFLYLKWRFKKVISMVMVVSSVLLIANVILINTHTDVRTDGSKWNVSDCSGLRMSDQLSRLLLVLNILLTAIPFAVSLAAFLLLIFSLCRHLKNMQQHSKGCRDASTTAHLRALKMAITFLILFIAFFLCLLAEFWSFEMEKCVVNLSVRVALITLPFLHSCTLILGNSKLRQALLLALQWMRCRLKNVEGLDP